jgi:hypothetical protein
MNILDIISCLGAGIAIKLFLNFATRSLRPLPPSETDPQRVLTQLQAKPEMNYRENWLAYYRADGGEVVIAYEEKMPQNGRGRLVFIEEDKFGRQKPAYQVLGMSYRTFDGTRTLWDSEIPDES